MSDEARQVMNAALAIIARRSDEDIQDCLDDIGNENDDFTVHKFQSATRAHLIHVAARYGRDFVIQELVVERNVSILVKDSQDWTALHHSIVGNHPDTCSFIQSLCKGNEWETLMRAVTVRFENVLHLAARNNFYEMIDFVLSQPLHPPLQLTARTQSNETALFFAAESNDIGTYEHILRAAPDAALRAELLNQTFAGDMNLMHVAIRRRSTDIARRLLSNNFIEFGGVGCGFLLETATAEGKTALHMAFDGGLLTLAADLINVSCTYGDASFGNSNLNNRPCLHNLMDTENKQTIGAVERLLNSDPDLRDQHLARTDGKRQNALHRAVKLKSQELVEVLLRLDSNSVTKNRKDARGFTPLLRAVWMSQKDYEEYDFDEDPDESHRINIAHHDQFFADLVRPFCTDLGVDPNAQTVH